MARISISIPDELAERLEPVKDHLNVSQVCRDALEQRVITFEAAADSPEDEGGTQSLAGRFREEHRLDEEKMASMGRRNAASWLRAATYKELKHVIDAGESSRKRGHKFPHSAFRIMKRELRRANGGLEGSAAAAYKTAWGDYVKAVWVQVERNGQATENGRQEEPSVAVSAADGEAAE